MDVQFFWERSHDHHEGMQRGKNILLRAMHLYKSNKGDLI
jgi:hypothetical protein